MCKIGVLAIGVDLYTSAFQHFQVLLIVLQQQQDMRRVAVDLAVHFLALMTLVQTFRGRVNRQVAGRITFPVLAVKFALELGRLAREVSGGEDAIGPIFVVKEFLVIAKSVVFLMITGKLAFGKDSSYVAHDEWFPRKRQKSDHEC
ncbi:hypothetical protein ACHAWF_002129 [Thalassiosira exigua]